VWNRSSLAMTPILFARAPKPASLLAWFLLSLALVAPGRAWAVTDEELRHYGFGDSLTNGVDKSRELEPPKVEASRKAIPAPILPGLAETKEIPRPTGFEDRTIRQAYPKKAPPFEGPTEPY